MLSGVLSTAATHPLELIRARLQISGLTEKHSINEHLIVGELKKLQKSGEWFKGMTPRLLKKPLANTLTFLTFELIEEIGAKKNLA